MILAVLFSVAVQASASPWPDACGKDSVQFKVKTSSNHLAPAPEAGKGLLVFSESVSGVFSAAPTARFGVDGTWVGADRGASYFAISVTPGEHHLCAVRQSGVKSDKADVGKVTLNVVAGSVYYFDFKITRSSIGSPRTRGGGGLPGTPSDMSLSEADTVDSVAFVALDESEGKRRTSDLPLSTYTAKP